MSCKFVRGDFFRLGFPNKNWLLFTFTDPSKTEPMQKAYKKKQITIFLEKHLEKNSEYEFTGKRHSCYLPISINNRDPSNILSTDLNEMNFGIKN